MSSTVPGTNNCAELQKDLIGYNHYWDRDIEIGELSFGKIVGDFQKMVLALDDLCVRLAGPLGQGLLEIALRAIVFNGLAN
jgi:hypothetical protein